MRGEDQTEVRDRRARLVELAPRMRPARHFGHLPAGGAGVEAIVPAERVGLQEASFVSAPVGQERLRPIAFPAGRVVEDDLRTGFTERLRTGYVVETLEAALWAFHNSTSFRQGALLAVNLGDDADTTGAIYGQLAGAYYGDQAIPAPWREKLAHRDLLEQFADKLLRHRPQPA